jgi:hypothetical protein
MAKYIPSRNNDGTDCCYSQTNYCNFECVTKSVEQGYMNNSVSAGSYDVNVNF